jgi:hypothetical protein
LAIERAAQAVREDPAVPESQAVQDDPAVQAAVVITDVLRTNLVKTNANPAALAIQGIVDKLQIDICRLLEFKNLGQLVPITCDGDISFQNLNRYPFLVNEFIFLVTFSL